MKLFVVESPTKAKKIQELLGEGYLVLASGGHVRDLPPKELGVDVATFTAEYGVLEAKAGPLKRLREAAKKADHVYLATDPDREGEAIAWHIAEELRLTASRSSRVRYDAITARALQAALSTAGPLDMALVNAQQARRMLDRLVGWKVSPLLQPLGRNHSAGRVQSAALHLVVQRERARATFKPQDYWTLSARYEGGLTARYATLDAEGRVQETRLASEAEAQAVVARAQGPHLVREVKREPKPRRAPPPFTTMELQQEAGQRLKLSLARTMDLAQGLFEGGFITYHRTDSPGLSEEALTMARAFLAKDFPEGLPEKPNTYKAKASAQEAHEAIRPTSLEEDVPEGLTGEAAALYALIRARFLACQCKPAVYDTTTVMVVSGDTSWRAKGSVLTFEGWQRYLGKEAASEEEAEATLPRVQVGEALALAGIDVAQKQTQPPGRFTWHSLAREMERVGLGRPSTFATYADESGVLARREYVAADAKGFLSPTERGLAVDEALARAFPSLVAADYTADMEGRLDEVAVGKRGHVPELREWWAAFSALLEAAPPAVAAVAATRPQLAAQAPEGPKATGKPCPRCQRELYLHPGKRGPYLGCSGWRATPQCEYTASPDVKPAGRPCPRCQGELEVLTGKSGPYSRCLDGAGCAYTGPVEAAPHPEPCPGCQGPMERAQGKHGPYARCLKAGCGRTVDLGGVLDEKCPRCLGQGMKDKGEFLSCARFPECEGTWDKKALAQAKKRNRTCPTCNKRLLREVRGQKGKLGCSGYPVCKHLEEASR